jgi:hypothetical protein
MSAADRVKMSVAGVDPDAPPEGEGEAPPEDDKDEFDDDKEFHVKKGRKK